MVLYRIRKAEREDGQALRCRAGCSSHGKQRAEIMSMGRDAGLPAQTAHQRALAVAAHRRRALLGQQLPPGRAHRLQALPHWAERVLAPPQRCCSPAPPPCLQCRRCQPALMRPQLTSQGSLCSTLQRSLCQDARQDAGIKVAGVYNATNTSAPRCNPMPCSYFLAGCSMGAPWGADMHDRFTLQATRGRLQARPCSCGSARSAHRAAGP